MTTISRQGYSHTHSCKSQPGFKCNYSISPELKAMVTRSNAKFLSECVPKAKECYDGFNIDAFGAFIERASARVKGTIKAVMGEQPDTIRHLYVDEAGKEHTHQHPRGFSRAPYRLTPDKEHDKGVPYAEAARSLFGDLSATEPSFNLASHLKFSVLSHSVDNVISEAGRHA